MATEVKLPDLGEGIEAGDVLTVMVSEGERIERDQGILEIETDKATVEVPSSAAGTVQQVHVSAGQTIKIGAVLVTLEQEAAAAQPSETPPSDAPVDTPSPTAVSSPVEETDVASQVDAAFADPAAVEEVRETARRPPAAHEPPVKVASSAPGSTPSGASGPNPRADAPSAPITRPTRKPESVEPLASPIAAGPAVRRFAREVGVDLTTVKGSGDGGRITREDVLEMVRRANRVAQGAEGAGHSAPQTPGTPSYDDWGPISIEPASRIRKTIAAKMHESWSTVPRITNFDDADMTELEKIRKASKDDYAANGVKLTTMPFIIKAVSLALRKHSLVNASYDMENSQIVYKRYVNVGIAVDTDRGLVVPALRNTDDMSISDTAKELAQMADRVRAGNVQLEDLRGGTFTISNLGAIGGTYATPIINVPEVAILLVGRARKLPVVVDDEVVVRLMMPLSLSYDHRLVDGATAARFLNDVIGYLKEPGRLLLAP